MSHQFPPEYAAAFEAQPPPGWMRLPQGVVELSGMGRRIAARLLDGLFLNVCFLLFFGLAGMVVSFSSFGQRQPGPESFQIDDGTVTAVNSGLEPWAIAVLVGAGLLYCAAVLLYEPVMTAKFGGTLGKLCVGIRVVALQTGKWPPAGATTLRYLIYLVIACIPLLNFVLLILVLVLAAADPRRQGWHDKGAGTVVILGSKQVPRP